MAVLASLMAGESALSATSTITVRPALYLGESRARSRAAYGQERANDGPGKRRALRPAREPERDHHTRAVRMFGAAISNASIPDHERGTGTRSSAAGLKGARVGIATDASRFPRSVMGCTELCIQVELHGPTTGSSSP
jgi:hypothetical protein